MKRLNSLQLTLPVGRGRSLQTKIEISTRLGSTWSIVHAVASEDAEIMVAAGAALAAPMNRISESLRLL